MRIRRAKFILLVVQNYEANSWREGWTVEDSFVLIAENIDMADMNKDQYNKLMTDCKLNVNRFVECES